MVFLLPVIVHSGWIDLIFFFLLPFNTHLSLYNVQYSYWIRSRYRFFAPIYVNNGINVKREITRNFIFTNIMNEVNVIMYIYEMVERLSSRKM